LFKKAGLKVLFALLVKPELLNEPYCNIAHAGTTALGTVAYVFKDLKQLGYLKERGEHGKKIFNKEEAANIVPPLLIYADLLRTADERNIETAKLIYEREILGLIN
jgi:hypothetical protein